MLALVPFLFSRFCYGAPLYINWFVQPFFSPLFARDLKSHLDIDNHGKEINSFVLCGPFYTLDETLYILRLFLGPFFSPEKSFVH